MYKVFVVGDGGSDRADDSVDDRIDADVENAVTHTT